LGYRANEIRWENSLAAEEYLADIERFVEAQNAGRAFESALDEIEAGRKRGHWIWFIFPQLSGLGVSYMSQVYAIADRDEAFAYLRHPVLFPRLLAITMAAAEQIRKGTSVDTLMGSSIDAAKLVSSLTLFANVVRSRDAVGRDETHAAFADAADEILAAASTQGFPPCRYTLAHLDD
jgi:uncharacterized protein (DUF1810 family)